MYTHVHTALTHIQLRLILACPRVQTLVHSFIHTCIQTHTHTNIQRYTSTYTPCTRTYTTQHVYLCAVCCVFVWPIDTGDAAAARQSAVHEGPRLDAHEGLRQGQGAPTCSLAHTHTLTPTQRRTRAHVHTLCGHSKRSTTPQNDVSRRVHSSLHATVRSHSTASRCAHLVTALRPLSYTHAMAARDEGVACFTHNAHARVCVRQCRNTSPRLRKYTRKTCSSKRNSRNSR